MKTIVAPIFKSIVLIALGIVIGVAAMLYREFNTEEPVHILQHPLMMVGGDADSQPTLLPKGTALYYEKGYPEGFVMYKMYVNVEGVMLETHKPTEKFWLKPMNAFPVQDMQLRELADTYPLSKTQLAAILESGQISKDEIRALLQEFSRD